MSKKVIALCIAVVMGLAVLAAGCGGGDKKAAPAAPAKKVIKISIGLNEQSHEYAGLKKFKEEVEKNSKGRYEVQLYANAQLGDDVKATEALRAGTLEMTAPSTSPLTGMSKELGVFDLPFIFPNSEVAYKVLDGPVGQKILDSLQSKGLVGLAFWDNGFRHLTNSVREVKTPEDVKGMKVRTMQNPMHLAAWKALGANPTPMPFSEVFTAMQQKTIDGQENPVPTIYQQKFYEVQKYCTLTGHIYTPFVVLMSKKVWDGMSKEDQKIFKDAAVVARDHERKVSADMNKSQVEKLRQAGMTVTELTPAQLKAFQDAVAPVYGEFSGKIGADIVKAVQEEVKKLTKK
ncbi:TRAP transporter substrate-binding protein [Anaeroselena agilis]|uniref:TRAP transporter substrate-binding protein n=1 Tax=Anaeroselena agilis TaxID=3063788 RepID=A0ABU3P2P7_9FIRM|nr:TRAP transporter substrate-binding protein [Selenomonadales bacterium 4137-cl]